MSSQEENNRKDFIKFKEKKYYLKLKKYSKERELNLSGLGIEQVSQVEGLNELKFFNSLNLSNNPISLRLLADLEESSEEEIQNRYGIASKPLKFVEYCKNLEKKKTSGEFYCF